MASRPSARAHPTHEPETRALRALGTAADEAAGALARRMGMHPTDLAAMSHIAYARDPLGPRELSTRLGITPAAMTDVVDRLETAGHLLRRRDTADRRRVQLVPTDAATTEVRGQLAELLDTLDAITEEFDDAERAAILRYVEAATAAYARYAAES
ncbi:MarR family winged helix-turn-helix transcriptional regulator [Terracoccus luteus]|jgi:DNA-binding MarR family transcriptional regulator|uniref:DNA-binding MarR family transcriptional regulator n=1 Tax=Terracoccus luteus TaxID=53356 RepID=A0A495XYL5_9MICO|nr:MarR family winged helix-turn-helix transcriptional regulator [Terracoccus luteus]MBB2987298.1 DNA-binding MarR family transcriptional regulator [Terracoccus luteus]MCP2172949.1 DNA-binding MarR family transcriptional regulator [Terracoccus luteus]RKT79700.1 DNA-binding MarR family transcriptional regulator [Terracoccus luteus]